MKFYKTTGFIYKIQNYADADKLVWILTKNNGKVNSIAKGVKKVTSKRAGHIDILNYNQFSFHKGRNLDTLTETKIINSFNDLKKDRTFRKNDSL